MRLEFRVIQMFDSKFHIFSVDELHNSSAIPVDISIANISGLSHMIFDVLPASSGWQPSHKHSVIGAFRWRATSSSSPSFTATETHSHWWTATRSGAPWVLNPQAITIIVIAISTSQSVISVSRILEFNKSKWRPFAVLQVHKSNIAVLVKQIFNVLFPHIGRQITYVNSGIGTSAHGGWRLEDLQDLVKNLRE